MALIFRSILDDVEYDEPINISDVQLSIVRDEDLHGIGFEASTVALQFVGTAAAYIDSVKKAKGLKAQIHLVIEQSCDPDNEVWEAVIDGQINIGAYNKNCGDLCTVAVPIENSTCETLLKNLYNQQVDIDKAIGFDGMSVLKGYFALGLNISLPTRNLDYISSAVVADAGDVEDVDVTQIPSRPGPGAAGGTLFVRPDYATTIAANIKDTVFTGGTNIGFVLIDPQFLQPITPQVLFDEPNISCFPANQFKVNGRLKGTITFPNAVNMKMFFKLHRGEIDPNQPTEDPDRDVRFLYNVGPYTAPNAVAFDWTFAEYEWAPNNSGTDSMILHIAFSQDHGLDFEGNVTFDKETFFKCETTKSCPPTETQGYLIHETLSRVTEAISNNCVRVKSSYYGRTDSEPFDFPNDGCGGLRFVTSGLKIRNAPLPTFSASLQDLIEGLQCVDNIGMGFEPDPDRMGQMLLRVEDLDFFYRDVEVMRCANVNSGQYTVDVAKAYSLIEGGYQTWETQADFGLDEFNSTREWRTALTAVNNTLNIASALVTGQYPIELTREQQYEDTSAADTTYDNNIFLICMKRVAMSGYPYGEMIVEQGNIIDDANMFSPDSTYNFGISPTRNLMRWFRSIAAGYPNISDSDNRIYFNTGTGNFIAAGELSTLYGGTCRLENGPIKENQDISVTNFAEASKATPLWRTDVFTFEYPMSLADWNNIKANPYGYISFQCGNGDWEAGYIKEAAYTPAQGTGQFTLKLKW